MAAPTIGMLTEATSYAARLMMHYNPFSKTDFLIYLVTLSIAPAFLTPAVYFCVARIVERKEVGFGHELIHFMFCSCDFLVLLLQGLGGAIASLAKTESFVSSPSSMLSIRS
jgi:hypothetical protein